MTIIYRWMGFSERVVKVIEQLMCGWWTVCMVTAEEKKEASRWINIRRGFLQGDSLSPLAEVPAAMLIEQSDGYMMGPSAEP